MIGFAGSKDVLFLCVEIIMFFEMGGALSFKVCSVGEWEWGPSGVVSVKRGPLIKTASPI